MNKNFLRVLALVFLMSPVSLAAQDASDAGASDSLFSDESLFGSPAEGSELDEGSQTAEMGETAGKPETFGSAEADLFSVGLVEEISSDAVSTAVTDLLESDEVIIGGNFSVSMDVDLLDDPGNVTAELSSRLFLDARPSSDFGVYIKGDIDYDPVDDAEVTLREMFADTNVSDTVFLRAGKQAVNWGVGYFYSPANVINLETVDPENPEEELLGPLAVRAHLPLGTTNFYAYTILEDFDGEAEPRYAAMGQFLAGNVEVSLGGIYQWDAPWAGVLTATTAIGDVSLFGEAVVEGDVDRNFVVEDEAAPMGITSEAADGLYYSATAGFNYLWNSDDENCSILLLGQYYYNGLGYADQTVITDNPAGVGTLITAGDVTTADLMSPGRHYGAASLSLTDVCDTGLTPSVFWMGNLADGSGRVNTGLSYKGIDNLIFSLSWGRSYGDEGMEFSPDGVNDSISLSISFADSAF